MHALSLSTFAADFHGTSVNIIDHAGHKWLTAADVGRCLGYAFEHAGKAINTLYRRHADEFTAEDTFDIKLMSNSQGNPNTGVGDWCAPGPAAEQHRRWMLVFEDADRGPLVFDDEAEARMMFHRAEGGGWNCHLFQTAPRVAHNAGHTQTAIAKRLGISKGAISMVLHGRYRFSPDAGVDLTTPELVEAVAKRHIEADLERLTQKYCASAANRSLEHALDDAGTHLLNQLSA